MQEAGPEKHQPLLQQPKPKLQIKLQRTPQQEPKPKSAPTHARWLETVPLRTQSQRASVGPGPALTARSSMIQRHLILRSDKRVPLPNKMDLEIASPINRALFDQKEPASHSDREHKQERSWYEYGNHLPERNSGDGTKIPRRNYHCRAHSQPGSDRHWRKRVLG